MQTTMFDMLLMCMQNFSFSPGIFRVTASYAKTMSRLPVQTLSTDTQNRLPRQTQYKYHANRSAPKRSPKGRGIQ